MGLRLGITLLLAGICATFVTGCSPTSNSYGDGVAQCADIWKAFHEAGVKYDEETKDMTKDSKGAVMYPTERSNFLFAPMAHLVVDYPHCYKPGEVASFQSWLDTYKSSN